MAALLEITPRIVAYGSRLVQLHQVTSVQLASVSPWRGFGRLLIGLGGALLVAVLALPRTASGSLGAGFAITGNGGPSVVGLLLLGLGLLAYFYNRDFLVIATADGEKLRITSHDQRFMMDVVDAIRAAMSAGPGSELHYVVNVVDRQIERQGLRMGRGAGEFAAQGDAEPDQNDTVPAAAPVAASAEAAGEADAPDVRPPGPRLNVPVQPVATPRSAADKMPSGDAAPLGPVSAGTPLRPADAGSIHGAPLQGGTQGGTGGVIALQPVAERPAGAGAGQGPLSAAVARSGAARVGGGGGDSGLSAGATPIGAGSLRVPLSGERTAVPRFAEAPKDIGAADIDRVVQLLRVGEAPHLEQLIQLLDVVKRHTTTQPPRLAEARQGWTAFSEYARRYLGDVDGLEAEVKRLDAVLLADADAVDAAQ